MSTDSSAVSTGSNTLQLSKTWKVKRHHRGFYTGGKVFLSSSEKFMVCLHGEDLTFLDLNSGQVLRTLDGETDGFLAFALHPNDKEVVTACRSGLLKHWRFNIDNQDEDAVLIRSWKSHEMAITDIAFDPTSTLIATASLDRTVRVWNVAGGFCTHSLRGHHQMPVRRVVFHPGFERLLLVSADDEGGLCAWLLHPPKAPSDSSKHKRDKSGSSAQTAPVTSHPLVNHMSAVTSVAFSSDQSKAITVSRDKVLNVWCMQSFKLLHTSPVFESLEAVMMLPPALSGFAAKASGLNSSTSSSSSSADDFFVTAGDKGVLRVWSLSNYRCVAQHTPHSSGNALTWMSLVLATQTGALIGVSAEHNFYVWNLSPSEGPAFQRKKLLLGFNDEIISTKCFPTRPSPLAAESSSSSSSSTSSYNTIFNSWAALATNSEQIRLLHLGTFDAELLSGHTDMVLSLDLSPCGSLVVSASKDNSVRVWDVSSLFESSSTISKSKKLLTRSLPCLMVGQGHTDAVAAVAFSKKLPKCFDFSNLESYSAGWQSNLASGFFVSGSKDRTLKLWSVADLLRLMSNDSTDAKKSADGVALATSSLSVLAHEKDINALAVAPNDKLIASASADKTIKLWNSHDLSLAGVLRGHRRGVWAVEFSTVDRVLASASGDRTIRIWSMTDQTCLKTLEGHVSSVLNVSFVTHGMQLLSGAADGSVKLWTLKTNECVNTFEEHQDKVWSLSTHSTGKFCVTGGADSIINVWEDVTVEEADQEQAAAADRVLKEQALSNCVQRKQWSQAVGLALDLEQPRRLLGVLEEAIAFFAEHELDGIEQTKKLQTQRSTMLPDLLAELSSEQLGRLLRYCRDWNTHGRQALVAHRVLAALFQTQSPDHIKKHPQLKEVLPALIPYSERHFTRLDGLLQKSFLIDYTLLSMKKLCPLEDTTDLVPEISFFDSSSSTSSLGKTSVAVDDVEQSARSAESLMQLESIDVDEQIEVEEEASALHAKTKKGKKEKTSKSVLDEVDSDSEPKSKQDKASKRKAVQIEYSDSRSLAESEKVEPALASVVKLSKKKSSNSQSQ